MWKDSLDFIVLDTDDGRPLDAGAGIEPAYAAYETAERPLLPSRNEYPFANYRYTQTKVALLVVSFQQSLYILRSIQYRYI